MSPPVFLLLSILLVQGRGCDYFMENVLSVKREEHEKFRQVFPKDYRITHHYNDSLLFGSGPCHMVSGAYMLRWSWSRLHVNLWEENLCYRFIIQLDKKLGSISNGKFKESPDASVFPPVSSTPEELLNFTTDFFSTWLKEGCPSPVEPCEIPFPTSFQKEGNKSDHAPLKTTPGGVEGGRRPQRGGVPTTTSLATSTHLSVIFWCFPLLWIAL